MFNALNNSTLDVFAESFALNNVNGDIVLQGIFSEQRQDEQLSGAGFFDKTFTLELFQSTVDYYAINTSNTVTVRGIRYQIIGRDVDTTGMATLHLRRYS